MFVIIYKGNQTNMFKKRFFVKFFKKGFLDITIKGNFKKFFGKKKF